MNKIAFIGAGNMNRAVIVGLINNGVEASSITVSNPSAPKREALAEQYNINQTASNIDAARDANIVVLGVKPHLIEEVCRNLAEQLDIEHKCFISVAAGTTMAQIQTALGGDEHNQKSVIRAMPNTPSQLGLGVSGAFASSAVTDEQRVAADRLMKATGIVKWLEEESDIDNIIAVSGSGPAYFFLFMEAMAAEAERLGFSADEARALVQQTALGAANMVVENDITISELRENVTSKGGTTQAALKTFTDGGLPELVSSAMQSAIARAKEMAQK